MQNDVTVRGVAPPIHFSTTFERNKVSFLVLNRPDSIDTRYKDGSYDAGFIYSRHDHPTRLLLESTLASLEGAKEAAFFASGALILYDSVSLTFVGMAAATTII